MPKGTPRSSGSYKQQQIYVIERHEPDEIVNELQYWFVEIARVPADGYARYNETLFKWYPKTDLPSVVSAIKKEGGKLFGYRPNEPRDFIKDWEPRGPYRNPFWK